MEGSDNTKQTGGKGIDQERGGERKGDGDELTNIMGLLIL